MKQYLLFLFGGILNLYVLLFYLGFSAGLASWVPIPAILGALLLVMVASWMTLYRPKIGSLLGIIFLSPILLWHLLLILEFVKRSLENVKVDYREAIIFLLLMLLVVWGAYQAIKIVLNKHIDWDVRNNDLRFLYKVVLTCIPLSLILVWIVSVALN